MATARDRVKVSFTDEEKARVQALAAQLRLNRSELLRRLVLGHRLPDAQDFVNAQAIRDLLKVNADQARLGNLMKLLLDVGDADLTPATLARIDALLESIHQTQVELRAVVKEIHHDIHPRAAR
jgi:Ribbon-helix-helix protein, copG family.